MYELYVHTANLSTTNVMCAFLANRGMWPTLAKKVERIVEPSDPNWTGGKGNRTCQKAPESNDGDDDDVVRWLWVVVVLLLIVEGGQLFGTLSRG